MLGPGTYLELAGRKMFSRWGRTFFTLLCISLGVAVLAAVSSLVDGVHGTLLGASRRARSMRDDVIWLAVRSHHETEGEEKVEKGRLFLTDEDREALLARPGVLAVAQPEGVYPVHLDLPGDLPRRSDRVEGVSRAYMQRYLGEPFRGEGLEGTRLKGKVPVVLGCHLLNLFYDEERKIFRLNRDFRPEAWIGTEFELVVGDNYVGFTDPFEGAWRDGRGLFERVAADQLKIRRRRQFDDLARRWDMNLFDRTLRLQAVVVGFSEFETSLVPLDLAAQFKRWLQLRSMLSRLGAATKMRASRRSRLAARLPGRAEAGPKRYFRLRLLMDDADRVEAMRKELDEEGFRPRTLDSSMVEELKVIERVSRIVRRFFYGLGFLLVCVSGCFIWLTVGKSVSDSRREIGVLRAVGATRGCICRIFLVEAALLGLGGGILGVLCGWCLAWALSVHSLRLALANVEKLAMTGLAYRFEEVLPQTLFHPDPSAALAILGITIVVSCLAGLIPSLRAAWVDPVQALRYE